MEIITALGFSYIPSFLLAGTLLVIRFLMTRVVTNQGDVTSLFSKPLFWIGILLPGILGAIGAYVFYLFDFNPWQLYQWFMLGMITLHFVITILAILTRRDLGLGLLTGTFSLILLLGFLSPH